VRQLIFDAAAVVMLAERSREIEAECMAPVNCEIRGGCRVLWEEQRKR